MNARLYAYAIALGVFALDRLTKILIRTHVMSWDSYTIVPGFFNIIHTENPGAAFSLFSDAQSAWKTFFLVALSSGALAVVATLLWRPVGRTGEGTILRIGLALILGGALGNVYDRIVHGTVTDFLELYVGSFRWPAFNLADSAITIGAALVLLDMLLTRRANEAT
jgi:signal peptidase II